MSRLRGLSRKEGDAVPWSAAAASTTLGKLFGVFGIAPVITRTSDVLPLLRNSLGFIGGAVLAYLIAQSTVGRKLRSDPDQS